MEDSSSGVTTASPSRRRAASVMSSKPGREGGGSAKDVMGPVGWRRCGRLSRTGLAPRLPTVKMSRPSSPFEVGLQICAAPGAQPYPIDLDRLQHPLHVIAGLV